MLTAAEIRDINETLSRVGKVEIIACKDGYHIYSVDRKVVSKNGKHPKA